MSDLRGKQGRQWKLKKTAYRSVGGDDIERERLRRRGNVIGLAVEDEGEWFCSDASCASASSLQSKELEPEKSWPFSMTAVDEKKIWYGKRKVHRNCYDFELTNGETGYCLKALRTVVV